MNDQSTIIIVAIVAATVILLAICITICTFRAHIRHEKWLLAQLEEDKTALGLGFEKRYKADTKTKTKMSRTYEWVKPDGTKFPGK